MDGSENWCLRLSNYSQWLNLSHIVSTSIVKFCIKLKKSLKPLRLSFAGFKLLKDDWFSSDNFNFLKVFIHLHHLTYSGLLKLVPSIWSRNGNGYFKSPAKAFQSTLAEKFLVEVDVLSKEDFICLILSDSYLRHRLIYPASVKTNFEVNMTRNRSNIDNMSNLASVRCWASTSKDKLIIFFSEELLDNLLSSSFVFCNIWLLLALERKTKIIFWIEKLISVFLHSAAHLEQTCLKLHF